MSNENDMLTEIAIALFLSVACLVAGEPISGEPATTHDSPITNRRSPITDHQKSNSALAYMNGARVADRLGKIAGSVGTRRNAGSRVAWFSPGWTSGKIWWTARLWC